MMSFPLLKTGVEVQYSLVSETQFATDVVLFIDGSEQRFRRYAGPLHRWTVRFDLLDEAEPTRSLAFFRTQRGINGALVSRIRGDGDVSSRIALCFRFLQTSIGREGTLYDAVLYSKTGLRVAIFPQLRAERWSITVAEIGELSDSGNAYPMEGRPNARCGLCHSRMVAAFGGLRPPKSALQSFSRA